MRAALQIAGKDLRQRVRDRSAFLWGFVAPVGLAFIFSLVLGGVGGGDAVSVAYGIVDQDGGAVASVFTEDVLGSLEAEDIVERIEPFGSAEAAEEAVAAGDLDAAFVIPPGFSDAAGGGAEAAIEVIGYVDSPIGTQVARAIARRFAAEINGIGGAVGTVAALRGEPPDQDAVDELIAGVMEVAAPLTLGTVEAVDKQLDEQTFYSAGMAVLFLFLTVQFGVLGLLEERTNGTMQRLLAAPIGRWSIVFGKGLTSFVLGILSMTAIVVVTTFALGADWGDPLGVAVLVLAGVLAAMGVMTVVAAFARTAEQAQNLQAVVALLLAMLGGAFFPLYLAGGVIERLSLLTPHAWFLRGLGDLAGGAGVGGILGSVWPILLFAAVTMAVASLRLRRVVEP